MTINASHTLDPDEIEILGTAVPWGSRELRDLTHSELLQRFVTRFKLSYSDANPRASVLFGKLRGHAPSTVAKETPARTVTLSDAECEVLGIEHTPEINITTLTAKYQKIHKLSFEDAQNEAVRLMRRLSDRGPNPKIAAFSDRVRLLCNCRVPFEQAQHIVVALSDAPDGAFNPDRDAQYVDEAQRQAYLGLVLVLTAILQAPLGRARDALLQALSNTNTEASLVGLAQGVVSDPAWCRAWATRTLITIGGGMKYDSARFKAEELVDELQKQAGRSFLPNTGITDEAAAAVNASGREVERRRKYMIDASQFAMAQRHAGRR